MISKKFQCLSNLFLVQCASLHYAVWSTKNQHFYQSFSWSGYTNISSLSRNDNLHDTTQYSTVNYSTLFSNISSLLKLYCKRLGIFTVFCLKLYLESLFPSWHLQWKFFKLVFFFNSEETVTDWSWLLNQS